MKFTLSWLKNHLDTEAPLDVIVETLTKIGLEVEHVENPAEKLAAFRIAEIWKPRRIPTPTGCGSVRSMSARARPCRSSAARPMRGPG